MKGTLPTDPLKQVARGIRYTSLGVRSVSLVGDFLEIGMCRGSLSIFIFHSQRVVEHSECIIAQHFEA